MDPTEHSSLVCGVDIVTSIIIVGSERIDSTVTMDERTNELMDIGLRRKMTLLRERFRVSHALYRVLQEISSSFRLFLRLNTVNE